MWRTTLLPICVLLVVSGDSAHGQRLVRAGGPEHTIVAGEFIRFYYFAGQPCLLGMEHIQVKADGAITLPIAGPIRAEGLTRSALTMEIEARLRRYIRRPEVVLRIIDTSGREVR